MAYPGPTESGQVVYISGSERVSWRSSGYDRNNIPQGTAVKVELTAIRMVGLTTSEERRVSKPPEIRVSRPSPKPNPFSDIAVRHSFIIKVFLTLTVQLLVTITFDCVLFFAKPIKNWILSDGLPFYIVSYFAFVITYIVLGCSLSARTSLPGNIIGLCLFTLAFSYVTAAVGSYHQTEIVLVSIGISCGVCLTIALFAFQTKIDFTVRSGLLFALVMVLFFFGLTCLIVFLTSGFSRVPVLHCVYAALGTLVFASYLCYDIQEIVVDNKHEMSPDDYIFGAVQLYIDFGLALLFILCCCPKFCCQAILEEA